MTNLFAYLLEASLALLAFFGIYFFILRYNASYTFNRIYLLGGLLLAMLIPLIHVPTSLIAEAEQNNTILWEPASDAWNYLPELVIYGNQNGQETTAATELNWLWWVGIIYLSGLCISLIRSTLGAVRIMRLVKRYPSRLHNDKRYKLALTNGEHPTFSFLHYIFWDNTCPLSKEEENQILQHEIAHVKQKHSLDILLAELMIAVLWFNPLPYLYKRALQQTHEFLADHYALQQSEPAAYLRLIVKNTFRQANLPLISTFFQHNTLTRIRMIQNKPNHPVLRAGFSLLLAGTVFFVASCEDEITQTDQVAQLSENNELAAAPEPSFTIAKVNLNDYPNKDLPDLQIESAIGAYFTGQSESEKKLVVMVGKEHGYLLADFKDKQALHNVQEIIDKASMEHAGDENFESIVLQRIVAAGGEALSFQNPSVELLTDAFPEEIELPLEEAKSTDQVFEVVEDQPEPVGGMEAFYTLVKQQLVYPEEAKVQGIEGRVFIQFVVEEDGQVSNVKTIKGLGHGLDDAAEKLIRASSWEPGRQRDKAVRVRMIMPVTFKL